MNVLVARHGLSEANNKESLAFGSGDAHLMEQGRMQAGTLGFTLRTIYDIDTDMAEVAVSELVRTKETAKEAGFKSLVVNPLLNEATRGLDFSEVKAAIDRRRAPRTALASAEAILVNPPEQGIWITHGLIIAGLCQVLGVKSSRFIPKFCEIRELSIN